MSTQAIEIASKNVQDVEHILTSAQDRLAATLPRTIPPSQFIIVAMDLIRGTPSLMEVMNSEPGRLSVVKGIFEASDIGLLLTRHLGQAYLVPFKNGDLSQQLGRVIKEVQMIIGYRGFCHLIQHGDSNVRSIYSTIVWPEEAFQYNGPEQLPFHEHSTQGGRVGYDGQRKFAGFVGCYAVVAYKDGSHRCEWMPLHEIDAIRERSKAKDNGPWITDPAEMTKKCPLRRMAKWLPLTPAITAGIVRDEYREAGVEQTNTQELPRVQMPRRLSETTATASGLPQAASETAGGSQQQTQGIDYGADIPPLCPKCGGGTSLKALGITPGWKAEWGGPKWRCKTCAKGTKGCTIDAAAYHEQEEARKAKEGPGNREPGEDADADWS